MRRRRSAGSAELGDATINPSLYSRDLAIMDGQNRGSFFHIHDGILAVENGSTSKKIWGWR